MTSDLAADVKVQCPTCNSVLVTTMDLLQSGEAFDCRFCGDDLRPTHRDGECNFCRGNGYAVVNGVIWICQLGAGFE